MLEKIESLVRRAKQAAEIIKKHEGTIRILADYDCDGITASAILVKALLREGKSFHLTNTKQINAEQVAQLANCKENLIIFVDFGSGKLKEINQYLLDKDVIIIDHHLKQGDVGPRIVFVNPIEFGVEGDISSSGVAYLVARAISPENKDLSEIAIIGAIGDSQVGSIGPHWGVYGINSEILKDAKAAKKIKVSKGLRIWGRNSRPIHKALELSIDPYIPEVTGSESQAIQFLQEICIDPKMGEGWRTLSDLTFDEEKKLASAIIIQRIHSNHQNPDWIFGEIYELTTKPPEFNNANEFATMINACGKLGKAPIGIGLCLNDPSAFSEIHSILDKYRRKIGEGLKWVYSNKDSVLKGEIGDYIVSEDKISEHLISNVISILHKTWDEKRVLFGFSNSERGVKISARSSDFLIKKGINLKEVLYDACKYLGGEGGGHSAASGGTIPKGSEKEFIKCAEQLLIDQLKLKGLKPSDLGAPKPVEPDQNNIAVGLSKDLNKEDLNKPSEVNANGKGTSSRGEETSREESSEHDRRKSTINKKMEGQGLVQYFGS